jgi:outer membrane protein
MTAALGALAALVVIAPPARAQDESTDRTIRVRPGIGAQVRPEYPGSDKSEVLPYIKFSIARGTKPFAFSAPDDGFGIGLLSMGPFRAGPAVTIQGERKDSDVGLPLGRVKRTFEVGGFAEIMLLDQFRVRADLRKGLGGHEGLIGSLGADQIWRDGDRYVVSVGPRLLFSDKRYQRAYFGVTPEAALATGLPAYRPGGGLHAIAAAAGLDYSLGGPLGLFGYARAERLVSDAAKSPVVEDLGSRNQLSAGLGLNYTFAIRR